MLQEIFESMETRLLGKIQSSPDAPHHRDRYSLEIARLGRRLYSGTGPVAYGGVAAPYDILAAMGISSCFVEFLGAMLASGGAVTPVLEEAEDAGYSPDTCGYHRSTIGAARQGLLPVPDFLVGTTFPCSGGLAVLENLARHYSKDLFVLHIPKADGADEVSYLADQIERMVAFIARHTGQALDPNRLRAAVEKTNEASRIMTEVYELARHVPSPVDSSDLRNFAVVMALFLGTEGSLEVVRAYREEFGRRVSAGVSGLPGERFRLMWLQNRIQFKHPLEKFMATEFGASVVVDELNDVTWDPIDPDDPFSGVARRILSFPLNGSVERRIRHLRDLSRRYKIDGAINPCHWGCRQGTGARGLIESAMGEIGVPVLNLEVDCVDVRNFAEGQLRTRIEAFFEMLDGRRAGAIAPSPSPPLCKGRSGGVEAPEHERG